MVVNKDPETAWTGVYFLRDYHPYWVQGQRNSAFTKATDGRLLDLKDNEDQGVTAAAEDFKEGLDPLDLPAGTMLVIVPGHEAMESNEGALSHVPHTLSRSLMIATLRALIR